MDYKGFLQQRWEYPKINNPSSFVGRFLKDIHSGRNSSRAEWYRLDNVAKIYPVVKSDLASNVFKVTASLNQEIDPNKLQEAVCQCRKRFPTFYVKIRKGLFWYYYEPNDKEPLVMPESSYVCEPIDIYKNNWFYFTFFYYKNRISLEIFHGLTDGKGALEFLKTVIYRYLELSGYPQSADGIILHPEHNPSEGESEDSYLKSYSLSGKVKSGFVRAYKMRGTPFPQGGAGVNIGTVNTNSLLNVARARGATISQYLSALYIYCIMLTGKTEKTESRPINVTIPIDMRKYYHSITLRNFFLIFKLSVLKKKGEEPDFDRILQIVKKQFGTELTTDNLQKTLNSNVYLEKNIAARFVPLAIKYIIIKLANFFSGGASNTTNMSNLGEVKLPNSMKEHVQSFDISFVLGKRSTHNIALISYNGNTTICLTRKVVEDDLDNMFFLKLKEDIEVKVHGNDWGNYIKDLKEAELVKEQQNVFPPFERKKRRDRRLAKSSAVISLVLITLSILLNIFVWKENFWSIIASAAVLYVWIIGLLTLKKTLHVGLKMMLHAMSLSGLLMIINTFAYTDESVHRVTWAISYGIPVILTVFIVAINITMFFHKQNRRNFLLYQISLSVMGLIPLIFILAGAASPMWPSVTAAACSYITIVTLIFFANKIILSEFKKKFHI